MGNIVKADHLLWIDLETTGLDVKGDRILEVGVIYTDLQLNKLWEWQSVTPGAWPDAKTRLNDFTRKMHAANGLLADCQAAYDSGVSIGAEEAAAALSVLIPQADTVALAGSGIAHLDRKFIDHWMIPLADRLEYYSIDTGVLRRCLRIFGGEQYDIEPIPESFDTDVKAHRALADVRAHLREAQAYKDKLAEVAELAWQYGEVSK